MSDASDPRPVMFSILEEIVPCPDRVYVRRMSGIQAAWQREAPPEFLWFWTRLFVQNPELVRRMEAAYHEIGRAFADLERLHAATYGRAERVPRPIVELVRRRVLAAWFASSREVLNYAVADGPVGRAARDLKRWITEEAWRREFSS